MGEAWPGEDLPSSRMSAYRGRLLPRRDFLRRQFRFLGVAILLVAVALAIGVAGYMGFAGLGFTDAFLNASMILGGMGPVDPLPNAAAKWFASFYALFSGIILLGTVAVMLAPLLHRILHVFHLDEYDKDR